MAEIIEVIGADNKVSHAIVHVLLDNQEEAEVFIGGGVEAYFDEKHGKYKAFIKRRKVDIPVAIEDVILFFRFLSKRYGETVPTDKQILHAYMDFRKEYY